MSYTSNEAAIVTLIYENLTGYNAENTKAGDLDSIMRYAIENNSAACIVDYAGGDSDAQRSAFGSSGVASGGKLNWYWRCLVTFLIPYRRDDIETNIRSISDNFVDLSRDHKRLSTGATWTIQSARTFEVLKRNDRTFVPVAFTIEIKDPL